MKKIYGSDKPTIVDAFKRGEIRVAIYGLGKMGLPLAAIFADKGAKVIGADINKNVVEKINRGVSCIEGEPGLEELVKKNVECGRLIATADLDKASRYSDVMVIIVPTFLDENSDPNLEIVKSVSRNIANGLEKGDFVILESTVPPGTTSNIIKPILEQSGLKAGEDFGLAHCPERTSSGRAIKDIQGAYPKIVGGIDKESTSVAEAIYSVINENGVIPTADATTAEAIKIAEGLYRDVNIALANELAFISKEHGINVWEVIKAANTQPFCNLHHPGTGVGGHCIPVYPWFVMTDKTRLIKAAREINDGMPEYVVERVSKLLGNGAGVKGSNILVVGLVYRPGVKETYHTPARYVIEGLKKLGANVYGYDPMLSEGEMKELLCVESYSGDKIDCAVFMHDYDYDLNIGAKYNVNLSNLFL